ncbi:TPA_asm: MC145.1R [Molluscum contagiosum virus]|uniref:MC145.1R n=1 Tax=Molluscum contagiosum virus TaxID=10279 RepID=A0A858A155_9POXV|nr:MC145.1 [Molluscum contagiosum virus subtype 1]QHW16886.1 MC145.1R [Molluscum contagiosum virus]AQY17253.1 MC145.1 [Molluscum contagiosum virus subtype 1]AYO87606.1 MC145.1 [Molluscum contagiosum virus subtype 1]AYO88465.1 MC145.1 [Molluscum contagiosum virus subtype 1]
MPGLASGRTTWARLRADSNLGKPSGAPTHSSAHTPRRYALHGVHLGAAQFTALASGRRTVHGACFQAPHLTAHISRRCLTSQGGLAVLACVLHVLARPWCSSSLRALATSRTCAYKHAYGRLPFRS